jgi:UPF0755 protein
VTSRLIGLLIILASFIVGWLWMDYQQATERGVRNSEPVILDIAKGQGLASIAEQLKRQGVIDSALYFRTMAHAKGVAGRLKYGEYEIQPGTSIDQLLALLASGKVKQHAVTLVEGWRFSQVRTLLAQQPALAHSTAGLSDDEVMKLIDGQGESPEGRFFPDTYYYTKGTPDTEVLGRSYRKMRAILDEQWRSRAPELPLVRPEEALTLASIVEKETAREAEMPTIAGVFVRRLQKGMRLQTDPTVIFGMGSEFHGDIRKDDLARDTPYNTYVHEGLPPSPIALPSAAALHAALHPEPGAALYFVSKGDGTHAFSDNYDEHRKLVEQFQMPHND